MRLRSSLLIIGAFLLTASVPSAFASSGHGAAKPSPDEVIEMLKAGNARFVQGKAERPHADATRLKLAGSENQGDYAYATVLTCCDSRVPVEILFDAGVMDIFVVRVAGNVCKVDEIGSIEYGLVHVRTPVLVVLGHTHCGAVTAMTLVTQGRKIPLERNIPPLIAPIKPAVERAIAAHPSMKGRAVIPFAIEENVWQSVEDLFMQSPATRNLVKEGKAKVVGAIYDVGTGKVKFLSQVKVEKILKRVEASPKRALNPMAKTE